MSRVGSVKKIGILGNVGNGNLGDEAIFAAIIDNLRRCHPGIEFGAFTLDPKDTEQRHKIPAFPARRGRTRGLAARDANADTANVSHRSFTMGLRDGCRVHLKRFPAVYRALKGIVVVFRLVVGCVHELLFLTRSYRLLREFDVLIVAGSGPLFDYFGGPWGYPYTLFKWSLLAKASRTQLAFVSVGAGPINSRLSRFFIRQSLSLASFRSYRDVSSRELIEMLPVCPPNHVFPDLAFSWRGIVPSSSAGQSTPTSVVGINPMPFFAPYYWPEPNAAIYQHYVRTLAAFASWLIEAGHIVAFFPTQLRADPTTIADIKHHMRAISHCKFDHRLVEHSPSSIEDLVSGISSIEIMVATRFHGIVISYLMSKPVLGISYHQKTRDLMADLGQADYCIDAAHLDLKCLVERFCMLQTNKHGMRHQIERKISVYRSALGDQYNQILALRTVRPRRVHQRKGQTPEQHRLRHLLNEGQEP